MLVHRVFDTLDPQQSNAIAPATLLANYDAARHPLVSMGIKTAEEVRCQITMPPDYAGVAALYDCVVKITTSSEISMQCTHRMCYY